MPEQETIQQETPVSEATPVQETAQPVVENRQEVAAPKGPPTREYIEQMNARGREQKTKAEETGQTIEQVVQQEQSTAQATPEPSKETKVEPQVIEKEIIKEIIKYPEFSDERAKNLFDHFLKGETDSIYNYLTEMRKNYDTMAHADLVREHLALKNPSWTKDDIELELRAEYPAIEKYDLNDIDKDTDPEGYKDAVANNKLADQTATRLERAARDARLALKENQKAIEFPKIQQEAAPSQQPQGPTQEQVEAAQRAWAEAATSQVSALEGYKFEVGDKEHPENVEFAITAEDKAKQVEMMKSWSGADFMKRRGWQNEDGSFNILKIAQDERTLDQLQNIVKSAYGDGFRNGSKKVIAEDIKNRDSEAGRQREVPAKAPSVGQLVWG